MGAEIQGLHVSRYVELEGGEDVGVFNGIMENMVILLPSPLLHVFFSTAAGEGLNQNVEGRVILWLRSEIVKGDGCRS